MWKIWEDFAESDGCIVDEIGLIECAENSFVRLKEEGQADFLTMPKRIDEAIEIIEKDGLNVEDVEHIYELSM